jgi:membrane protein implicated in regulation of membrane protease activity
MEEPEDNMIANPEISLSYRLTYREFVAGYKLGVRQSLVALFPYILARFVAPLVACFFLLMAITSITSGHATDVAGTLPVILLCAFLSVFYFFTWRTAFKRLKRDPKLDPQMTFQADETSFVRVIEGMGEVTWLWSATDKISHNKEVVLVSASKGAFVIIPRAAITDSQLSRLRELLQQNKA